MYQANWQMDGQTKGHRVFPCSPSSAFSGDMGQLGRQMGWMAGDGEGAVSLVTECGAQVPSTTSLGRGETVVSSI